MKIMMKCIFLIIHYLGKTLHGDDDDDDLKEKTWYVCDEFLFPFLEVSGVNLSPASSP